MANEQQTKKVKTLADLIKTMDTKTLAVVERNSEIKQLVRKATEIAQRERMDELLKPSLDLANKALGKNFKNYKTLAKYILDSSNGGASTRLTEENKSKMDAMLTEGKLTPKEIAATLGLKPTQVYNYKVKWAAKNGGKK